MAFRDLAGSSQGLTVINIADAEIKFSQDAVHQMLKSGARISHDETGVVEGASTIRGDDFHLWNVFQVDRNLVVPLQEDPVC